MMQFELGNRLNSLPMRIVALLRAKIVSKLDFHRTYLA